MTATWVLCRLDAIEDGGSKGLWPDHRGRDLVLAVRKGRSVHTYVNACPHYGKSRLGWKKDAFLNGDGSAIICAAHGALFGIEDGICTVGPCLGQALTRLESWVEDGNIVARLDDLPVREGQAQRSA